MSLSHGTQNVANGMEVKICIYNVPGFEGPRVAVLEGALPALHARRTVKARISNRRASCDVPHRKTKKRAAQQSSSTEPNSSRRIRWYMNRETQCDTVARRRPQTHEHTDTQTPRQTQTLTQSLIHTQCDIVARQSPHSHNHTDTQRQCHRR
jgi:hypothetical protein